MKKAPTRVPGTRRRRERPTYTVEVEHPLAPAETATITFRSLYWHEHREIVETYGQTFAAVLAIVKRAIVEWSLSGEPTAMLDRMHEKTIRRLHEHVRVIAPRAIRRREKT